MIEIFIFSIKMMFKNKMRSLLTMLGIIIGILSLILIIVFGNSFSSTFQTVTDSLFKNDQLFVSIIPTDDNKNVVYDEYGAPIIPEGIALDIREVEKQLKTISEDSYLTMGGYLDKSISGEYMGRKTNFIFYGACANELSVSTYSIIRGRDFTRADELNNASVAVMSDVVCNYLFNGEDPIGKSIDLIIEGTIVPVNIIGVYKHIGIVADDISTMRSLFFINHTFLESELAGVLDDSYWQRTYVSVTMNGVADKAQFEEDLVGRLESALNYDKWTLDAYSLSEQVGTINEMMSIILKVVFVIAAISLVIGGIGIMNVMLITVTERTNEIGVRKALGADNLKIMYQFLCESFVLSLSGTVIGVVLGFLISKLMAYFAAGMLQTNLKVPVTIDVTLPIGVIILAVLFSLVIGVVFGLYPALKAVKMQVVDALRYE